VDGFTKSLLPPSEQDVAGFVDLEEGEVTDSDQMIARMLQLQFDKEHDEALKRTEAKYNGTSKGNLF
jgi:hypothetical protein